MKGRSFGRRERLLSASGQEQQTQVKFLERTRCVKKKKQVLYEDIYMSGQRAHAQT